MKASGSPPAYVSALSLWRPATEGLQSASSSFADQANVTFRSLRSVGHSARMCAGCACVPYICGLATMKAAGDVWVATPSPESHSSQGIQETRPARRMIFQRRKRRRILRPPSFPTKRRSGRGDWLVPPPRPSEAAGNVARVPPVTSGTNRPKTNGPSGLIAVLTSGIGRNLLCSADVCRSL